MAFVGLVDLRGCVGVTVGWLVGYYDCVNSVVVLVSWLYMLW